MFRQEKGFFRFYLCLILVLAFAALLCRSEDHQKASVTEIESCSHAASAWMKKDNLKEVVKDREQFLFNLLDCTKETHKLILKASEPEDCKTFDEMIPSELLVRVMNTKIPEAFMTRSEFATEREGLILVSVYLVLISHRIRYFSCFVNFRSSPGITLRPHHKKSAERLDFEFKQNILAFLDMTLMAQWKSDNTTILQNNGVTLINMLNNFSTTLINLLEEISSYCWWFNSSNLDQIKKATLASKTDLDAIKRLIKPYGFRDLFQSISDNITKWDMLIMTVCFLFILAVRFIPRTRS